MIRWLVIPSECKALEDVVQHDRPDLPRAWFPSRECQEYMLYFMDVGGPEIGEGEVTIYSSEDCVRLAVRMERLRQRHDREARQLWVVVSHGDSEVKLQPVRVDEVLDTSLKLRDIALLVSSDPDLALGFLCV